MVDLSDNDGDPSLSADPFAALVDDPVISRQLATSWAESQVQPDLHLPTHATSSTSASPFISQAHHKARRKSKDTGYHPLKGGLEDPADGITRPQLEKLVHGLDSWSLDDEESFNDEEERSENSTTQAEDEKVVLVHQASTSLLSPVSNVISLFDGCFLHLLGRYRQRTLFQAWPSNTVSA
jgi:hypothetical protein